MTKVRDRFDSMDLREKSLAASVGGALAGGFAGRSLGKSRLTTLAGAAAGALGARQIATRSR
jgi:outer membrane lipoprotein SlyB